jgi:catechol 2,3-dioxygenase-like lactoylglutathione lyase family enzyme
MDNGSQIVGGVDFVSVPSRDFEAAVEFYGTKLGLPCSARYSRAGRVQAIASRRSTISPA